MDTNLVGMKELYDINIRLNEPLEIGKRKYDINETILSFTRADIAQVQENKIYKTASGGYNNKLLVDWEIDKEVTFALNHGILSPTTWAILSNSKLNNKGYKSVPPRLRAQCRRALRCTSCGLGPPRGRGKRGAGGQPAGRRDKRPRGQHSRRKRPHRKRSHREQTRKRQVRQGRSPHHSHSAGHHRPVRGLRLRYLRCSTQEGQKISRERTFCHEKDFFGAFGADIGGHRVCADAYGI